MTKRRVTKIKVFDKTWKVPRGFGSAYRRTIAGFAGREEVEVISEVIDLLALVGYHATEDQVTDWDLRRRVEAVIYAATVHARASDNPIPRYPRPIWLPEDPWKGSVADVSHVRADLRGAFAGPTGTPIPEVSRE